MELEAQDLSIEIRSSIVHAVEFRDVGRRKVSTGCSALVT